ncbi:Na+-transporting NADH:ubiquinone oxidoreductase subunit D [Acholeplasma morum]|uniref:electron transport complex subunit RsxE n=1 Tax=Paracholeplasma morum TaxID=264637 RepID=UPI001957B99B|nr:electron transport complex subunit RsxE [Paracholeplasma morum]MBM7452701.1 Na+-transporting NADH:ubiquinone oxidoreductase subunit D [Paracholeplasma morum]
MNYLRMKYTKWFQTLKNGVSSQNPILISVLGICSALAVTNQVVNAIAMGLGVTFVVMASSATVSLLRNFIPSKVRMVAYMVIISTFVILVQMFLKGFFPTIEKNLSAYVGLIITNCIVMGRAEAYAVKNPVKYTLIDGFANGMGYTIVLVVVAGIRELLGYGTLLGMQVMPSSWINWVVLSMAPGGFFVIGLLAWGMRSLTKNYEE